MGVSERLSTTVLVVFRLTGQSLSIGSGRVKKKNSDRRGVTRGKILVRVPRIRREEENVVQIIVMK